MMKEPLLLSSVLTHAEKYHGDEEIVSRMPAGQVHRYTYRDLAQRVRQTARALLDLGLGEGACIATLGWNTYRHLELYFAIPCLGSVCHTINPRLFHEQIVYIINHALDPSPSLMFARRREHQALLLALRQLPIPYQLVLELYYWEQMQAGEIATVMKAPEGTIRTRIRRARQLLVREIEALAESTNDLQSTLSGLDEWAAQLRDELAREGSRG